MNSTTQQTKLEQLRNELDEARENINRIREEIEYLEQCRYDGTDDLSYLNGRLEDERAELQEWQNTESDIQAEIEELKSEGNDYTIESDTGNGLRQVHFQSSDIQEVREWLIEYGDSVTVYKWRYEGVQPIELDSWNYLAFIIDTTNIGKLFAIAWASEGYEV